MRENRYYGAFQFFPLNWVTKIVRCKNDCHVSSSSQENGSIVVHFLLWLAFHCLWLSTWCIYVLTIQVSFPNSEMKHRDDSKAASFWNWPSFCKQALDKAIYNSLNNGEKISHRKADVILGTSFFQVYSHCLQYQTNHITSSQFWLCWMSTLLAIFEVWFEEQSFSETALWPASLCSFDSAWFKGYVGSCLQHAMGTQFPGCQP